MYGDMEKKNTIIFFCSIEYVNHGAGTVFGVYADCQRGRMEWIYQWQ